MVPFCVSNVGIPVAAKRPPAIDEDQGGQHMPRAIEIDEIRPLLDDGAQLVEVLPAAEFEEEHLPGAINVPLKQMTEEATASLDRDRPVIVYCWDYQ